MARIGHARRLEVIEEVLRGKSYAEIAEEAGVAQGTITTIVDELEAGTYPEVTEAGDRYDALRTLAKTLNKQDATVSEALLGAAVLDGLTDLGIDVQEFHDSLSDVAEVIDRLETREIPPEEYLDAATNLSQLEAETDLRYDELEAEYRRRREELASLEAEIEEANRHKDEAEAERDAAIAEAETTAEDLAAYREFRDRAADHGLETEDTMDDVLSLIERYGTDDIERLVVLDDTLDTLDTEASTAQTTLDRCQTIVDCGFTLEQAEKVAEAFSQREEEFDDSLDRLVDQLDTHEGLTAAVHTLEQREAALIERVDSLEAQIEAKQEVHDDAQSQVASLRETITHLEETAEDIRADVEERRAEKQRLEREIDELGFEAQAIRSFLSFLTSKEISPTFVRTVHQLIQMDEGAAPRFEPSRSRKEQHIKDWMVEQLHAFTEETEAIAMSSHEEVVSELEDRISDLEADLEEQTTALEHERQKQEARETEQTLSELEKELQTVEDQLGAARGLLAYAADRSVSKDLLEELLRLKRDEESYAEGYLQLKKEELQTEVVEAINEIVKTEDAVIRVEECEKRLAEQREQALEQRGILFEYLWELGLIDETQQLIVLPPSADDPWMEAVIDLLDRLSDPIDEPEEGTAPVSS